jgi:hypothetical protein
MSTGLVSANEALNADGTLKAGYKMILNKNMQTMYFKSGSKVPRVSRAMGSVQAVKPKQGFKANPQSKYRKLSATAKENAKIRSSAYREQNKVAINLRRRQIAKYKALLKAEAKCKLVKAELDALGGVPA